MSDDIYIQNLYGNWTVPDATRLIQTRPKEFDLSTFDTYAQVSYGGWIDPNGTVWKTDDHYTTIYRLRGDGSYSSAFNEGWIRFVSDYSIGLTLNSANVAPAALDSAIKFLKKYLSILPKAKKYSNLFKERYYTEQEIFQAYRISFSFHDYGKEIPPFLYDFYENEAGAENPSHVFFTKQFYEWRRFNKFCDLLSAHVHNNNQPKQEKLT